MRKKAKRSRVYWTEQEVSILNKNVKQHGITIGAAKTAKIIDRAEANCMMKYYNDLKKKYPNKKTYKSQLKKMMMDRKAAKVDAKSGIVRLKDTQAMGDTNIAISQNKKTGEIVLKIKHVALT